MIICRTPLRISFFGGGTDYPKWYRQKGGQVISTTINKYSYITARKLPPFFPYNYRVRYFNKEETISIDDIKHPSVRECSKYLDYRAPFDIVHNSDLPARSGLGSSSTFTVGMLHALHSMMNYMPTKRELAKQALHIEQEVICEAVGSQDQVAAAFGGLNHILFNRNGDFTVTPLVVSQQRLMDFQSSLLLVFTGFARTASVIAEEQISRTDSAAVELSSISDLCSEALTIFSSPTRSVDELGNLLHEQWKLKRAITPFITSSAIDDIYETGLKHGAIGGKLLGAGGGGFMLFYAPPDRHQYIKDALDEKMFVPFSFENTGSQVIYFSHE